MCEGCGSRFRALEGNESVEVTWHTGPFPSEASKIWLEWLRNSYEGYLEILVLIVEMHSIFLQLFSCYLHYILFYYILVYSSIFYYILVRRINVIVYYGYVIVVCNELNIHWLKWIEYIRWFWKLRRITQILILYIKVLMLRNENLSR